MDIGPLVLFGRIVFSVITKTIRKKNSFVLDITAREADYTMEDGAFSKKGPILQ
jgi:hypothetical protein